MMKKTRVTWHFIFNGEKGKAKMICRAYTMYPNDCIKLHDVELADEDILEADKIDGCLQEGNCGNLSRIEDSSVLQSWGRVNVKNVDFSSGSMPEITFKKVDTEA